MRRLLALVALVAAVGCNLDTTRDTGPLVQNVAGVYTLQTMNGKALPFTIASHDTTIRIDTDVLTVGVDGDWLETITYLQTVGTNVPTTETDVLSGLWTRSGNSVGFRTSQGPLYIGTVTDTTLLLSDAAYNYVFKR